MQKENEVFVPVIGYENRFKISNYGQVISFNRVGRGRVLPDEKTMKCTIDPAGYKSTTLRMVGKKRWCVRIHTLVALHFVENSKPGEYDTVNHMDGNKKNNYYKNLEWCTGGMNTSHAFNIGLIDKKGERHHAAKVDNRKVLEIRELFSSGGLTRTEIGKRFGIHRRTVTDILTGACWAHI